MKKVLRDTVAIVLIFVAGLLVGWFSFQYQQQKNAQVVDAPNNGFDLRLPGEVEARVITRDQVAVKLREIGELSTYSGEYTASKSAEYTRNFLDNIPVLGTTNSISIECRGVVKVGYDMDTIVPTVDNDSRKIYIALPEPTVLDNYVIWDSVKYSESNNILNPIDFAQYETLIQEIEADGLAQAEENEIYSAAEENAKRVVKNFLSGFREYEIIFL